MMEEYNQATKAHKVSEYLMEESRDRDSSRVGRLMTPVLQQKREQESLQ